MRQTIEKEIRKLEEELRLAILHSDVPTLDLLLAEELIFTNHLGQVMSKAEDLQAHTSGVLSIQEISLHEEHLQVFDGAVIVSVRAHIIGTFSGNYSEGNFRFTRIWMRTTKNMWQVVAAHSCVVV